MADRAVTRVHDSLQHVLQHQRLVFWYDSTRDWQETFDSFETEGVVKLVVANNELATKVRIARELHSDTRFLVYVPSERPVQASDWLLDLVLQGHEFRADRASLALQEVGLSQDFLPLAQEQVAFFNSSKRTQELKELLAPNDGYREIRLKMMSVLTRVPADVDGLLLHFLGKGIDPGLVDPVVESLGSAGLVGPFWSEVSGIFGYASSAPTLRDFVATLFRSANPLDTHVIEQPHTRVFLRRWKDSQSQRGSFEAWSRAMEEQLRVAASLEYLGGRATVGESDTFESFEKLTVHRLIRRFQEEATAAELTGLIGERRQSYWFARHEHGYRAIENAIDLREILRGAELNVTSIDAGVRRYTTAWWKVDAAYRRFVRHVRAYGQVQLMEPISEWVEKTYVNNFLLPLADRWSDQVSRLESWSCGSLPPQHRFFEDHVQPFLSRGQKLLVIVSDALRYEAAAELTERLHAENRWTAELGASWGALPSYTQLGMASLLPGRERAVDAHTATVTLDGRSATGTANRGEILAAACAAGATAIQAEEFLDLNRTDGRDLMRENQLVYVFHNHIDKVGDAPGTEAKTADAVENAFEEIEKIVRKAATFNVTNMVLTADHGFLFQYDPVDDGDMTPLPSAREWTFRNRRFALGRDITPSPAVKVFSSTALGVTGDWSAAFPLSLGRFPLQGSGKRYVHGGVSLQEVIVPIVRIHKARADDTAQVEVELLRPPAKITTGQVAITLYQDRAAVDKVRPRSLRVGVYAKDGTPLSELRSQTFDSQESEPRLRETNMLLSMAVAADRYNNHDVELRLEELVPGTEQWVTYKTYGLRLQKPFMSDFDDL